MQAAETAAGAKYRYAAKARLDSLWFDRLPKQVWSLMTRGVAVVPAEQAFGGINDRFALAPRASFQVYSNLYDDLMLGRGAWSAEHWPPLALHLPAESSHRQHLDAANV